MANNVYYFSHDGNARNDEKILMLRAEHGWEGYGIYWVLIEMMFESSETSLKHRKTKGIAAGHNIDITLLEGVIETCVTEGLFQSNGDTYWSDSLRRRKQVLLDIKEKKSQAGKKGMAKRWGSDDDEITEPYQSYNTVITENNKGKERKGNKEKESKEDTTVISPEAPAPAPANEIYDDIVDLFHHICSSYPEIRKATSKRKQTIAARVKEYEGDIKVFEELFLKAQASEFLKGGGPTGWQADFDWLIEQQNMAKILEGKYDKINKAPEAAKETKFKTAFHLPESRGANYTNDELEAILLKKKTAGRQGG